LIVVNFSGSDPSSSSALPAALAGIIWMLFATPYLALRTGAHGRNHVHLGVATQQRAGDQFAREKLNEIAMLTQPRSRPDFVRLRPVFDDGARDG